VCQGTICSARFCDVSAFATEVVMMLYPQPRLLADGSPGHVAPGMLVPAEMIVAAFRFRPEAVFVRT